MLKSSTSEGPKSNSIGPSLYNSQVKRPGSEAVKVVWSGWDTLYLSYRLKEAAFVAMHDILKGHKEEAQATKAGAVRLGDLDLYISAKGRPNYQYVLIRPNVGEVAITLNPLFPPVRVRLYSEYIIDASGNLEVLCSAARSMVEDIFGVDSVTVEQVSEAHLAIDFVGWSPRITDWQARRFLCHTSPKIEEYDLEEDQIHSMRWAGSGRPLSAALYNKTKEIVEQSPDKAYMFDLYGQAGYQKSDGEVYRLEFRINRDGLRDLGVNNRDDLDAAAIIRFFMGVGASRSGAWLSFRALPAGGDTNNQRWPVAGLWLSLREQAIARFGDYGVLYKRVRRPRAAIDKLVDMAGGCVASIVALRGEGGAADTFAWFHKQYLQRLGVKGKDFDDLVDDRRARFRVFAREEEAMRQAELLGRLALASMGALR